MTDVYDEVAYPGHPYRRTHPDRLALLGRLHGLEPADPSACRVLEIGCGDGMNIVGMAAGVPGMTGVGIDRAPGPLERGRAIVDELGFGDRLRLDALDVREAGAELGRFDYVVAHGVYTWTPPDVRDAALALCGELLAPHGVAFFSYVCHPGGHLRTMVREIGLLGAAGSVGEQAARAQDVWQALAPLWSDRPDPYAQAVADQLDRLGPRSLASLVHDDLSTDYAAVWLGEFAEHAARHGLGRICEADVAELRRDWMPAALAERLDALAGGDPLVRDQLADAVAGRAYRESVLCRDGAPAEAAPCARGAAGLLAGDAREPVADAEAALERFLAGELELHAAPARWAASAGERPEAFALARLQARDGEGVTNLRHDHLRIGHPVARRLVTLLDGTRDRAAIAAELDDEGLAAGLDASLQRLADLALLV